MDKHTLSNYGWIVIATILISIFIVLAFIVGDTVMDSTVNMFPPEETKSTGSANVTISKSISVTVGDSYENSFEYTIGEGDFDYVRIYRNDVLVATVRKPDVNNGVNTFVFTSGINAFAANDIIKIECYKDIDTLVGSGLGLYKAS